MSCRLKEPRSPRLKEIDKRSLEINRGVRVIEAAEEEVVEADKMAREDQGEAMVMETSFKEEKTETKNPCVFTQLFVISHYKF